MGFQNGSIPDNVIFHSMFGGQITFMSRNYIIFLTTCQIQSKLFFLFKKKCSGIIIVNTLNYRSVHQYIEYVSVVWSIINMQEKPLILLFF